MTQGAQNPQNDKRDETLDDYFKSWFDQNQESIRKYYNQTFVWAKRMFILLIIAWIAEAIFFGITVYKYFNTSESDSKPTSVSLSSGIEQKMILVVIVGIIVGIFILAVAYMFFNAYKQTLEELSIIYDRIWINDKYKFSWEHIEKIQNDSVKNELYKKIIESVLEDARQLSEEINKKY